MTQAHPPAAIPSWKFGELSGLLRSRGLPDCKDFLDSFVWKLARFGFHADREKATWDILKGSAQPITVTGDDISRSMFEAETHVEAAAGVLDSLPDILAQVINKAALGSALAERAVSIKTVNAKLKAIGGTAALTVAIDRFVASPEFDYVNALVNSTKHRRIIKSQFRITMGQAQPNRAGLQLAAFTYDAKSFPEIWVEDLIGTYEPAIRDYITDIGIELNKYIATLPQVTPPPPPAKAPGTS
jgi:hypothetical protein